MLPHLRDPLSLSLSPTPTPLSFSLSLSCCLTIFISLCLCLRLGGHEARQCALVWRAEEFALLCPLRQEQIEVGDQSECAFQAAAEESEESGRAEESGAGAGAASAGAARGSTLCKC